MATYTFRQLVVIGGEGDGFICPVGPCSSTAAAGQGKVVHIFIPILYHNHSTHRFLIVKFAPYVKYAQKSLDVS